MTKIPKNREVKLVSFDYFNNKILNVLKTLGKVKVSKLVATFMKDFHLSDLIISYLVVRLIKKGKIKVIKYGERFFENVIAINDLGKKKKS